MQKQPEMNIDFSTTTAVEGEIKAGVDHKSIFHQFCFSRL